MEFLFCGETGNKQDQCVDGLGQVCEELAARMKELQTRDYGDEIEVMAFIPTLIKIDPEMEDEAAIKDRVQYMPKNLEADLRLRVNHEKFMDSDEDGKKRMVLYLMLRSLRVLSKKVPGNFKFRTLEEDILSLFQMPSFPAEA